MKDIILFAAMNHFSICFENIENNVVIEIIRYKGKLGQQTQQYVFEPNKLIHSKEDFISCLLSDKMNKMMIEEQEILNWMEEQE